MHNITELLNVRRSLLKHQIRMPLSSAEPYALRRYCELALADVDRTLLFPGVIRELYRSHVCGRKHYRISCQVTIHGACSWVIEPTFALNGKCSQ
jgi:hypothetical protein